MTTRCAIWQCERCTAYHIGGLDIEDAGMDGIRAVCGAEWRPDSGPDCELSEIPMVAVPVDEGDEAECLHCGYPILIGSGRRCRRATCAVSSVAKPITCGIRRT